MKESKATIDTIIYDVKCPYCKVGHKFDEREISYPKGGIVPCSECGKTFHAVTDKVLIP